MLARASLALLWLVVVLVALVMAALWVVFAILTGQLPLWPRRRRARVRVERRIPGRLVRLEDLAPADREILGRFRETA